MKSKKNTEYKTFENLTRQLVAVPHGEVKAKMDAPEESERAEEGWEIFRFPRGSLVGQAWCRPDLAGQLGIGQALSEEVRGNVLKSKSVVSKFRKVIPEHLFIKDKDPKTVVKENGDEA